MANQVDNRAKDVDVSCPVCEYNLRGLSEARCPECGAKFDWDELRNPERRSHPYLFEHHPERNVWSFVRTLRGLLWPWTFWKTLLPNQPSRPQRIVLFWLGYAALCVLLVMFRYIGDCLEVKAQLQLQRAWTIQSLTTQYRIDSRWQKIIAPYGSVQNYVDTIYPASTNTAQFYLAAAGLNNNVNWMNNSRVPHAAPLLGFIAIGLAWPWLTALTFMIFRISMRRKKIRPVHMMRIAVYNGDVIVWGMLLLVPAVILSAMSPLAGMNMTRFGPGMSTALIFAGAAPFVAWIIYALRLWVACRRYLRFDHAVATVISVQMIVALSIPATMVLIATVFEWIHDW